MSYSSLTQIFHIDLLYVTSILFKAKSTNFVGEIKFHCSTSKLVFCVLNYILDDSSRSVDDFLI